LALASSFLGLDLNGGVAFKRSRFTTDTSDGSLRTVSTVFCSTQDHLAALATTVVLERRVNPAEMECRDDRALEALQAPTAIKVTLDRMDVAVTVVNQAYLDTKENQVC